MWKAAPNKKPLHFDMERDFYSSQSSDKVDIDVAINIIYYFVSRREKTTMMVMDKKDGQFR